MSICQEIFPKKIAIRITMDMPWLRRLVSYLSPREFPVQFPFIPKPIYMWEKVEFGRNLFPSTCVFPRHSYSIFIQSATADVVQSQQVTASFYESLLKTFVTGCDYPSLRNWRMTGSVVSHVSINLFDGFRVFLCNFRQMGEYCVKSGQDHFFHILFNSLTIQLLFFNAIFLRYSPSSYLV